MPPASGVVTVHVRVVTPVPTYVYFNNDPGGAAVPDAIAMAAQARRRGMRVTRTP